ncbi:MAG: SulP family inorganic anion transporter [Proteobacteria bacterium]|nr:SulP family inorganic anion transporter [Pseudomonadota bacterium]
MKYLPNRIDILASLGVFVIALPLSLGIALASGAPIQSAIIAAVIGGIAVGSLSGAPLTVTGPAAGLTVVVFEIIRTQGVKGLAIATIVCGLVQFLLGYLKLGGLFKRMPHSILDGMLAAIGAIIAFGQLYVAMGKAIPNGFIKSLIQLPNELVSLVSMEAGSSVSLIGLLVAIATISVQLIWEKRFRKFSFIPGALVALVIMTAVTIPLQLARVTLDLSMSSLVAGVSLPTIDLSSSFIQACLSGFLLAAIGSIESLATASGLVLYAKKANGTDLEIDLNKELKAQGFGNFLSGIVGGLPVTSVIVRSAANIQFGATSRWSTILHGIWILVAVLALAPILKMIPLSCLAAVLIITGIRLVNVKVLKEHFLENRLHGYTYLATFVAILSSNLLKGIVIGIIVSVVLEHGRKLIPLQSWRANPQD